MKRHALGHARLARQPGPGDRALRRQHLAASRCATTTADTCWSSTPAPASAASAPRLPARLRRVDLLLTHLHMDHIQGLGFFAPLYDAAMEVHIWGPGQHDAGAARRASAATCRRRCFPVHLRDLPVGWTLHDVPSGEFDIGAFRVTRRR